VGVCHNVPQVGPEKIEMTRQRNPRHPSATLTTTLVLVVAVTIGLAPGGGGETALAGQQDVPEGYVQIIPRGGIPAIDAPDYVPAAEAQIRDDAWVLGVVIDGQARAYSLELLNSHEIVNDSIGDTDFAAVW